MVAIAVLPMAIHSAIAAGGLPPFQGTIGPFTVIEPIQVEKVWAGRFTAIGHLSDQEGMLEPGQGIDIHFEIRNIGTRGYWVRCDIWPSDLDLKFKKSGIISQLNEPGMPYMPGNGFYMAAGEKLTVIIRIEISEDSPAIENLYFNYAIERTTPPEITGGLG